MDPSVSRGGAPTPGDSKDYPIIISSDDESGVTSPISNSGVSATNLCRTQPRAQPEPITPSRGRTQPGPITSSGVSATNLGRTQPRAQPEPITPSQGRTKPGPITSPGVSATNLGRTQPRAQPEPITPSPGPITSPGVSATNLGRTQPRAQPEPITPSQGRTKPGPITSPGVSSTNLGRTQPRALPEPITPSGGRTLPGPITSPGTKPVPNVEKRTQLVPMLGDDDLTTLAPGPDSVPHGTLPTYATGRDRGVFNFEHSNPDEGRRSIRRPRKVVVIGANWASFSHLSPSRISVAGVRVTYLFPKGGLVVMGICSYYWYQYEDEESGRPFYLKKGGYFYVPEGGVVTFGLQLEDYEDICWSEEDRIVVHPDWYAQ